MVAHIINCLDGWQFKIFENPFKRFSEGEQKSEETHLVTIILKQPITCSRSRIHLVSISTHDMFRCHLCSLFRDISMCTLLCVVVVFSRSFDWPEKKKRIQSVQSMCTTTKFQANNWAHRMTFKNKQIWILSVFKCHRKHHSGPKQSIHTLGCMCRSCITVNPVVQASIFIIFNSIWVWADFFRFPASLNLISAADWRGQELSAQTSKIYTSNCHNFRGKWYS